MLFKFALRNVNRNKRRSLVSISTVAMGVLGILFLESFFSGLIQLHAENSIHSRHGHGQVNTIGYLDQAYEKPWEHWIDNPENILRAINDIPEVVQVFPRVQFFALLTNGTTSVAGRGQGIVGVKEAIFFNKMNIVEGNLIKDQKDGIVLGIGLARTLGVKPGDRVTIIGNTVHGSINALDLVVSGIFHVGMKEADDYLFQIQLSQAQNLLGTDKIESIALANTRDGIFDIVKTQIEKNHPQLEATSVWIIDKIWAQNGKDFLNALLRIFQLIFISVILLAIYNSASNTVLERAREIGMLRANGESNQDVMRLLTLEGVIIASSGALIGIIITIMISQVLPEGIPMPPTPGTNRELPVQLDLRFNYMLQAYLLGSIASIIATFAATLQVLQLSLAKALRAV
ncbi:MAG: hypothetical protein CMP10_17965 [Zetaproteobacteria bacterium]|nr:hypothetical protein [Pseudobdellovibrionaceae bacterium]